MSEAEFRGLDYNKIKEISEWSEALNKENETKAQLKKEAEIKNNYESLIKSEETKIWIGCDTGTRALFDYCKYQHKGKYGIGSGFTYHCYVCNDALQECCLVENKNETIKTQDFLVRVKAKEAKAEFERTERIKEIESEKLIYLKQKKEAIAEAKRTNKRVFIRRVGLS